MTQSDGLHGDGFIGDVIINTIIRQIIICQNKNESYYQIYYGLKFR